MTAESNALLAYGTTLQRCDESAATNPMDVGELLSLKGAGVEVGKLDVTHMGSPDGFKEKQAGLADRTDLVAELQFVPDDPMQETLQDDAETVPQPKRFWKIVWPPLDNPSGTYTFEGFVSKFEPGAPSPEGKLTATLTLVITGKGTRS